MVDTSTTLKYILRNMFSNNKECCNDVSKAQRSIHLQHPSNIFGSLLTTTITTTTTTSLQRRRQSTNEDFTAFSRAHWETFTAVSLYGASRGVLLTAPAAVCCLGQAGQLQAEKVTLGRLPLPLTASILLIQH